jgi:hypothetical protein
VCPRCPLLIRRASFRRVDALSGFVFQTLSAALEIDFVSVDVDVTLLSGVPVEKLLLTRYSLAVFFD